MSGLAEFLLARIGEEEASARAAPGPRWVRKYRQKPEPPFSIERYAIASPVEFAGQELGSQVVAFTEDDTAESKALIDHAVRWDPARVLAECAAKRAILGSCDESILHMLAAPFATHPDYSADLRP